MFFLLWRVQLDYLQAIACRWSLELTSEKKIFLFITLNRIQILVWPLCGIWIPNYHIIFFYITSNVLSPLAGLIGSSPDYSLEMIPWTHQWKKLFLFITFSKIQIPHSGQTCIWIPNYHIKNFLPLSGQMFFRLWRV